MNRPRKRNRISEKVCVSNIVSKIQERERKYSEIFRELILPAAQRKADEGVPFETAVKFAKKELLIFGV
jgi:hypothetical protein